MASGFTGVHQLKSPVSDFSIERSLVITGLAGPLIEFAPDGIAIRCDTRTEGGAANARLDRSRAEFDGPWLNRKPVVG